MPRCDSAMSAPVSPLSGRESRFFWSRGCENGGVSLRLLTRDWLCHVLARRGARRRKRDRAQYHLDSHADFPSLPPKLESEWRDYWTFFCVLLEIAPVISTIGDEDIFALAEKCFSLRPSPGSLAPSVSFTYKRTRLCAPALTRGLLLPPLQTSARASHSIRVSRF